MPSSLYAAERFSWEVAKILLRLLSSGVKKIAELRQELAKNNITLTDEQVRRLARYHKSRGTLKGNAKTGYQLTKNGQSKLAELELKRVYQPIKWDGKWRIVLFDVPEEKRHLRDQIRRLIKELHCAQLQKSVWIHPFDCKSQFNQIRDSYGKNPDILFIETDVVAGAPNLIAKFSVIYKDTNFEK